MSKYICKKIVELEESKSESKYYSSVLENHQYNKDLFNEPFSSVKNKLGILSLLSLIIYKYEHKDMITTLCKQWGLKCKIEDEGDMVYGIFYNKDFIIVVFKGTSNFNEVISDLQILQVDDVYCIPGKMHKGFHDILLGEEKRAEMIEKKVNNILRVGKQTHVYITGHSLGAALGCVFFSYLQNSPFSDKGRLNKDVCMDLTTFGSPRVGDGDFAEAFQKSTRVVNGNDIITSVPKLCFKHVGETFQIGNRFSLSFFLDHHIAHYCLNIAKMKD